MCPATSRTHLRRPAAAAALTFAIALPLAIAPPASAHTTAHTTARTTVHTGAATARTSGLGAVTPEMRGEIERVVAAGSALTHARGRTALVRAAARCATFEGQRYCLGMGWTTQTPETITHQLTTRLAARPATRGERTGDLDAAGLLARATHRSEKDRVRIERAELTRAAQAVGKVWMLRHEIQGTALPSGFSQRHPEVLARGFGDSYPTKFAILKPSQTQSQNTTYWCGPTAMQAIGWGASNKRQNQSMWARRLGTSTAGTSITDMVRVVNNSTDYDSPQAAGPYVVLDISGYSFKQWYRLMMRHIHDYRAPVVLHPQLLKQFYPYLGDDASGHFQVGRGFDQNPGGNQKLGYFEPWDQSRFDPSEPAIARVQWRSAYRSFRANLIHFQHNVGV